MELDAILRIIEYLRLPNHLAVAVILATSIILLVTKKFGSKIKRTISNIITRRNIKVKSFNQILNISAYIFEQLQKGIESIGCDRILIFEFHNGSCLVSGNEAARMTCTYEIVRRVRKGEEGKTKLDKFFQNKYNNVPVTSNPLCFMKALEKKPFFCEDVTKLQTEDYKLYLEMSNRNVNSFALFPITVNGKNIMGYILFEFVIHNLHKNVEFAKTASGLANRISLLLRDTEMYYEKYLTKIFDLETKHPVT